MPAECRRWLAQTLKRHRTGRRDLPHAMKAADAGSPNAAHEDVAPAPKACWTLSDFGLAWLSGLMGAVAASSLAERQDRVTSLILTLAGQSLAIIAYLLWTLYRRHGRALRLDRLLKLRIETLAWLFAGMALQIALLGLTALLAQLYESQSEQEVVDVAREARGVEIPIIIVMVVILAPIVEELLFRGVLLEVLLRRCRSSWVAVASSALVFGLGHILGDPSLGSLIALPAIVVLGLVLAIQVTRSGSVTHAILMHAGFNAVTAAALFT